MLTPLLLLFLADPSPAQTELLTTFRDEFIAVTPGEGKFPASDQVSDSFSIAKYEVPQNLWEAVLGANPSKWKGKRNSVEMLSLAEATQFCSEASRLMRAAKLIDPDQIVRLPSEAEWEYCARAGSTTTYSFGDDVQQLDAYAWHTGNAAGNDPQVGAKQPNPWGLYDVHGYLWEWTAASGVGKDAKTAVIRGGSWKDTADLLASASRREVEPDLRDDAVGLRCILATEQPQKRAGPLLPLPLGEGRGEGAPRVTFTALVSPAEIVPAGSKLQQLWGDGEFTEGLPGRRKQFRP